MAFFSQNMPDQDPTLRDCDLTRMTDVIHLIALVPQRVVAAAISNRIPYKLTVSLDFSKEPAALANRDLQRSESYPRNDRGIRDASGLRSTTSR